MKSPSQIDTGRGQVFFERRVVSPNGQRVSMGESEALMLRRSMRGRLSFGLGIAVCVA